MKALFTGHRYIDHFWEKPINRLIDQALDFGITEFLVGMAIGTDQAAAEVLIKRRLKWTAVIPCADQDEKWKPRQRSRYRKLLQKAHKQIVLYPQYSPGVMQARNVWMVKRSQLCLAIYDNRGFGGTNMTFSCALANRLTIVQFNPVTQEFTKTEPPLQLSLF